MSNLDSISVAVSTLETNNLNMLRSTDMYRIEDCKLTNPGFYFNEASKIYIYKSGKGKRQRFARLIDFVDLLREHEQIYVYTGVPNELNHFLTGGIHTG